jgi:hypothetical protein
MLIVHERSSSGGVASIESAEECSVDERSQDFTEINHSTYFPVDYVSHLCSIDPASLRPPSIRVGEAGMQNSGAENAPRERRRLAV